LIIGAAIVGGTGSIGNNIIVCPKGFHGIIAYTTDLITIPVGGYNKE